MWRKGGLAQGTASVADGLVQGTASVVDGVARGTATMIVYVCSMRIRKAIPLSLQKKDHIYLTDIPTWRRINGLL